MRASRPRKTRFPIRLAAGLVCAALAAGVARHARAQAVWDVRPYQVKLAIAADPVPELTPRLQDDLRGGLIARCDALVGGVWRVEAVAAPEPLRYAALRSLESVDRAMLEQQLPETLDADKVFLICIARSGAGYRATAREYDVRTQVWSGPRWSDAQQLSKLCDATFEAVIEAFAPLAQIEGEAGKTPMLNLRAGALPTRDPTLRLVHDDELFRPLIRYNDREGNPRRINEIAWTYLQLQGGAAAAAEGKRLPCTMVSGLRISVTGKRRGRMERLALGVIPDRKPTRLALVSRKNTKRTLPGYEILLEQSDSKKPVPLGQTDSRGEFEIDPGGNPLRVLLVRHGSVYLARLPVVAGVHATLEAPIPDDDRRLEAEAYITGFQNRLIDLTARRTMLMTQINQRIQSSEGEPAETLFTSLRQLPDLDDLSRELEEEKKRLLREEQGSGAADPLVIERIEKLFSDAEVVVKKHLDPAPVDDLSRKLAALKQ